MHTGLTEALLGYHAITGCDYVSCLFRKGKTTPFKRLIESTEHIQEMRTLTMNEVDVKGVTSFICSLYGHNTSHINVLYCITVVAKRIRTSLLNPLKI